MIKIDHWNFRYEDSKHKRHSLKDISLQLRRGQRIALVGESGSGKSTLLSLLRGLQRPAQGSLKVDGEMKDVSYLSAITTLIPQEPEIFENTIEYNITAGISHSQKEIFWACRLARFEHLLAKLPRGLKTHIQEKGVNLSGGEKQRLALARGLFSIKENSLILLDESTSSVDSINERSIYEAIFEAFPDKCIISSIHKLHLLPMFDYIYVLDHGVVVEEGKYEELLKKPGVLSKLVALYQKNEQA